MEGELGSAVRSLLCPRGMPVFGKEGFLRVERRLHSARKPKHTVQAVIDLTQIAQKNDSSSEQLLAITYASGHPHLPGTITDAGAGVRLRRGPDGRWHPFTLARKQWWPADGANASAGTAYQAAARARAARRANG